MYICLKNNENMNLETKHKNMSIIVCIQNTAVGTQKKTITASKYLLFSNLRFAMSLIRAVAPLSMSTILVRVYISTSMQANCNIYV